jgi:hypothetical protein
MFTDTPLPFVQLAIWKCDFYSAPMRKRLAETRLRQLWQQFPAVLILGARQVGKTTLALTAFSKNLPPGAPAAYQRHGQRTSGGLARGLVAR